MKYQRKGVNGMKLSKLVTLSTLCVLFAATAALAAEKYIPKVDNFEFMIDRSGSMNEKYVGTKQSKIAQAKALMERINKLIPELGYKGGLVTAANFNALLAPETYTAASYGAAIAKIPTLIGDNHTPLGDGLKALEPTWKAASGRNAIIILSDGQENTGTDSLKVATAQSEKYGVCFHTISFADTVNGNQELLDKLSALKSCGVSASAAQLADDAALQQFVKAVFYDVDAADPCALDDDADGVNNCLDKCPGTDKKLVVDAAGCPIPLVVKLKVNFDFDKADIKPQYHQELADFATFMKKYPGVAVEIDGHTDAKGSDEYNKKLSQRRANSVREYLVTKLGVPANLLTSVGFGESKPVATNDTDAGRAENRRIEAVFKGAYKMK
jgi:OOP family OmpA-OmpF porin